MTDLPESTTTPNQRVDATKSSWAPSSIQTNRLRLRVQVQLFKAAHSPYILLVDVTGNTLTTTFTQSSAEYSRNMKEEVL